MSVPGPLRGRDVLQFIQESPRRARLEKPDNAVHRLQRSPGFEVQLWIQDEDGHPRGLRMPPQELERARKRR